jgi:small subunit ribosomal protein S8
MDAIANLIIMLKNAGNAGKDSITVPFSNMTMSIAETLAKHGYVKSVSKKGKKVIKSIEVEVAYEGAEPKIKGVERISKLSRRMYKGAKDIKPFRHGFGNIIYSTPKGILTDKEAKKENVGGEILFKIW